MTGPALASSRRAAAAALGCFGAAAAAVALLQVVSSTAVAATLAGCVAALAVLAGWDVRTHRLPNPATAALAATGMATAAALAVAGQIPSMWPALGGLAVFALVGVLEALPADALGGGDAKLLAALGGWTGLLGWGALLPTLLCAHLVMLIPLAASRGRNGRGSGGGGGGRVVMGPAIAVGAAAGWLVVAVLA